jgi:hypothetical protein
MPVQHADPARRTRNRSPDGSRPCEFARPRNGQDLEPGGPMSISRPLVLLACSLFALPLAGCEDEFVDCMNEWKECTKLCASNEDCRETCDEEFAECVGGIGVCGEPASMQYYTKVNVADWTPHQGGILADESQTVMICEDHFPRGTPESDEIEDAIAAFARFPGTTFDLSAGWDSHLDNDGLFVVPPTVSRFDYTDNENDSFTHPCHPNETACGDDDETGTDGFTINTCKYGSGQWWELGTRSAIDFFTITANASCYEHFDDDSTLPFYSPDIEGAEHELGHAAGMTHFEDWPDPDHIYISTMQGKLTYLSAYDAAFLRHFYPEVNPITWRNFVASSKIRMDWDTTDVVHGTFEDVNPRDVYVDGDTVFDCETHQEVEWFAAWFNTGNADQEADHCMVNELRIEDPNTTHEVVLRQWHAAQMEAESQDQWRGTAEVEAADFALIPNGVPLDLVFEVNVYEQWREPPQDNEVRAPITVYPTSACSNAPAPPLPPPPIRKVSATVYELSRPYVQSLVAHPERILRGAPMAPEQVGAGIGFRFLMFEDDSIPRALGALKDDILWRVEGSPIGPNTAAVALQRLLQVGQVNVTILRNGAQKQFTYRLR